MGRLVAIDCGRKRTGIAVSDTLQLIANGLCTVATHEVVPFLADYVQREPVERFIVGLPHTLDDRPSESMRYVEPLVNKLRAALPDIPVDFFDERFTSALAHRAMLDGGLRRKERQNKALVDEISATIILQSYMESKIYNHKS